MSCCDLRDLQLHQLLDSELTPISKAVDGLVQRVVDNFNDDKASQNGKISTHSLTVLIKQPDSECHRVEQVIPRLKETIMTEEIDYDL